MFDPTLYADTRVAIVGLGNIGSHAALALARMGLVHFKLWDFDAVEEHNAASQAYELWEVGSNKAEATAARMRLFNPQIRLAVHKDKCEFEDAEIIVCAVDNLEARRTLAENSRPESFVIDGRVGGGQLEVYSQRVSEWAATIPESADEDACGMRFISYTSYVIAGLIANQVKRHLKGERLAKRIIMHCDTLQSIVTYDK